MRRKYDTDAFVKNFFNWNIGIHARLTKQKKDRVFKRDNFKCVYCGSKDNLTIDHIIPKALGGDNGFKNLMTLCNSCNNKKGDRELTKKEISKLINR